jgi:hypothetical protein
MVTEKQKRGLEYFQNKIVTFFVSPINRNFDEKQTIDYFVGKVINLDEAGIWYEHPVNKCKNFIFYDKIISISEEEIIHEIEDVSDPSVEEKEEMNKKLANIDVENMVVEIEDKKQMPQSIEDFRRFIS